MKTDNEIIQESIQYLNNNKKAFLEHYTKDIYPSDYKGAIFTAGMSGVGKTELAIFLKEQDPNLLHIDTDEIREFFRPIGYNGQNAPLFQKASSRGFSELFTYALKNDLSLILDSNFANINTAIQNIERLLKREYMITIMYLYNEPDECFEYATRRELVTHRKVPKDVFIRSNINSYETVIAIKSLFKDKVVLNFANASKTNQGIYEDIDVVELKKLIGDRFDIQ
jgi:adenylate kinase family enzyme